MAGVTAYTGSELKHRASLACLISSDRLCYSAILLFSEADRSLVSNQILLQVTRFKELDDILDSSFISDVLIIHGKSPEGSNRTRQGLAGTQPNLLNLVQTIAITIKESF
ncbi:hypothetical protein F5B18DRAFT_84430 [Nemania serpens]|nr:hypothetical protein F5B18DRAFT_84430 [Nemania serpens]